MCRDLEVRRFGLCLDCRRSGLDSLLLGRLGFGLPRFVGSLRGR